MKRTKGTKGSYPKAVELELLSGSSLLVVVNHEGFHVEKLLSTGTLFGELEYWPASVVWAGSAATLSDLLKELARERGCSGKRLLALIGGVFKENEQKLASYLAEEKKAAGAVSELATLRKKWLAMYGEYRIPGIPSPKNPWGDCVDGLDVNFATGGWKARLYSDSVSECCPELLIPQVWEAESFDGLFHAEDAWGGRLEDECGIQSREELAELLLGDDPRWQSFIAVVNPEQEK